jgi:hypothetical protein
MGFWRRLCHNSVFENLTLIISATYKVKNREKCNYDAVSEGERKNEGEKIGEFLPVGINYAFFRGKKTS